MLLCSWVRCCTTSALFQSSHWRKDSAKALQFKQVCNASLFSNQAMDTARYNLDPPPPTKRSDHNAWRAALDNAHAQLEHQYNR